jgi:FkbM family methyltransferase
MALKKAARELAKCSCLSFLKHSWLRRRLIFALKQRYFSDLSIDLPLAPGLICPLVDEQYRDSLSEIFIEGTYSSAFENISLPAKWIDLGCHAGYFSLYIIWQRQIKGLVEECRALLIDADPRVQSAVARLIELNNLSKQLQFQLGAIAPGQGTTEVALRGSMSSAVANRHNKNAATMPVPIITETDIMRLLAPPYDLIKVDIEGAEYGLLTDYKNLLQQSKYLLMEWHSWHDGGGGKEQIFQLAEDRGYKLMAEPVVSHVVTIDGRTESCGAVLFALRGAL